MRRSKLALADRDVYYADPLFADVPLARLLAPTYVEMRRPLIDPAHASLILRPGDPLQHRPCADIHWPPGFSNSAHDTTTCLVADGRGNVVAATPSGWSGVVAGATGVWLGSRLQSFNTWEGHPNVIEAGKRPRITLSPTLVLQDGRPVIAVSVAGGDLQDQVTLQLLLDLIDFGQSPAETVTGPRFSTAHHIGSFQQPPPQLGSLTLNPDFSSETINALKARGHVVHIAPGPVGAPIVLRIDRTSGRIEAAGDSRAGRHAAAY